MANEMTKKESGVVALRKTLDNPTVKKQFENALKDNADLFMASIIEIVSTDKNLQECSQNDVVREALKAAVLKLPLNRQLGFAYIVPFKEKGVPKPQFILGYKGLIQLAIRTGQYKHINAGEVYEGEIVTRDRITGDATISGTPKNKKVIGYFAYIELTNGFKKLLYKTKQEIEEHAKQYSKSYNSKYSPWTTDFDKMAKKTLMRE
jgi:recombination protein RecT